MRIGAPFNPYRVFQGAFAPFWLLEHRGLGAGAKLCYIRLLGFAGKDGRCYPSLDTLGASLGVSERQARDYVKELERVGLIVIEQRGLRRTNVYLFIWTGELEQLVNSVPDTPVEPEGQDGPIPRDTSADRNYRSGQERNRASAPDRNSASGQDRNAPSAPIEINSPGMSLMESSSSSAVEKVAADVKTRTTRSDRRRVPADAVCDAQREELPCTPQIILHWARERAMQRLRSDRVIGLPEKEQLAQWSGILDGLGIPDAKRIFAVLDAARSAADRTGDWRNWSFLSLQIQLAAERMHVRQALPTAACSGARMAVDEDADSEWAQAKARIRTQVGEIPFSNWFDRTRQAERCGTTITIAVPDEPTRTYLESEYRELIESATSSIGIATVRLVVRDAG